MFTKEKAIKISVPYCLVSVARDSVYYFVLSFYFLYLSRVLNLPLSCLVPMLIFIKAVDIIKEPFIGLLIDSVGTIFKVNKFRLSVFLGAILNALITIAMFNVPHLSNDNFEIIYCVLCFGLWTITFSFYDLPTWAVLTSFGKDNTIREVFASVSRISSLIGFSITLLIFSTIFDTNSILPKIVQTIPEHNFNVSSFYVAAFLLLTAFIFSLCYSEKGIVSKKIAFAKAQKAFWGNDQLIITFAVTILQQITLSVFVCSFGYFFLFLPKIPTDYEIFLQVHIPWMITAFMSLVFYKDLVKATSRKIVFIFSIIMPMTGFVLMFTLVFFGVLTLPLIGMLVAISACGFALSLASTTVMTADCIDYGEFKFGIRIECMNFSIHTVSAKIGYLFILIITGLSFSFSDIFVKNVNLTNQMYSIYLCILIVCICSVAMLIVYVTYYKLHGSFFENILNAITYFSNNKTTAVKEKFNSVRYAIDEHCVIYKLKANTLDEVIQVLTDRLFEVKAIKSKHDLLKGINEKIAKNPAGIAHGIAIPHTRGNYVNRSSLAVATLKTPLNCGASDNKPCDLFFLIAVPDDGVSHINLLSNLSLMLSEPGFADKLRHSGSNEEITKRLILCERNLFN